MRRRHTTTTKQSDSDDDDDVSTSESESEIQATHSTNKNKEPKTPFAPTTMSKGHHKSAAPAPMTTPSSRRRGTTSTTTTTTTTSTTTTTTSKMQSRSTPYNLRSSKKRSAASTPLATAARRWTPPSRPRSPPPQRRTLALEPESAFDAAKPSALCAEIAGLKGRRDLDAEHAQAWRELARMVRKAKDIEDRWAAAPQSVVLPDALARLVQSESFHLHDDIIALYSAGVWREKYSRNRRTQDDLKAKTSRTPKPKAKTKSKDPQATPCFPTVTSLVLEVALRMHSAGKFDIDAIPDAAPVPAPPPLAPVPVPVVDDADANKSPDASPAPPPLVHSYEKGFAIEAPNDSESTDDEDMDDVVQSKVVGCGSDGDADGYGEREFTIPSPMKFPEPTPYLVKGGQEQERSNYVILEGPHRLPMVDNGVFRGVGDFVGYQPDIEHPQLVPTATLRNQNIYARSQILYDEEHIMGKGTLGTVYKATIRATGTQTAIKVLHPCIDCADVIKLAVLLQESNDPNIVQFLGVSLKGPYTWAGILLFEYMEYNLATIFSDSQYRPLLTYIWKLQSCSRLLRGLKYLHDKYITHCNLKIENCLLSEDFKLKISDFGCSDLISRYYAQAQRHTIRRWSPEVVPNVGPFSFKADIWDAGCVMIQILSEAELPEDPVIFIPGDIANGDGPVVPIDPVLKSLLEQCLNNNPSYRPTCEQALHEIDNLLEQLAANYSGPTGTTTTTTAAANCALQSLVTDATFNLFGQPPFPFSDDDNGTYDDWALKLLDKHEST
ncbi:Protein kinase domain [Pelomyxa schiedti]|nr:Protein kinase domain [Pelomyxa schiedti]